MASPLLAEEFWKTKPASQWTLDEALRVVQDSPWAKEEVVMMPEWTLERREAGGAADAPRPPEFPRGHREPPGIHPVGVGLGVYLVRWETARPVAEAFTRLEQLGEHASATFQAPAPRRPDDRYVVTVKTTRPAHPGVDLFEHLSEQELREGARLKSQRGAIPPVEVERTGVGATAAVHFYFSRLYAGEPLLRGPRERVEFRFQHKRFRLTTKFKLDKHLIE